MSERLFRGYYQMKKNKFSSYEDDFDYDDFDSKENRFKERREKRRLRNAMRSRDLDTIMDFEEDEY